MTREEEPIKLKVDVKIKVEVEVRNISVDDRYFSFESRLIVDGRPREWKYYENDYQNGKTREEWKEFLEEGYAFELALQDFNL